MPAAAVIPAPIAYINVVAVKKLVVGFLRRAVWSAALRCDCAGASHPCGDCLWH